MGIAIEVGFNPVALDADFLAAGGTELIIISPSRSQRMGCFQGYKNNILRYAPNAQGSFNAPTVAYTQEEDGSDRWHQWRWENLRISGTGIETLILAGGKTWRPNQGYHLLSTTDGETFDKFDLAEDFKVGGGASSFIRGRVLDDEEADWVYASLYPGSSNGTDTRFVRRVGDDLATSPMMALSVREGTPMPIQKPTMSPSSSVISTGTPHWLCRHLQHPKLEQWPWTVFRLDQAFRTHTHMAMSSEATLACQGNRGTSEMPTLSHGTLGGIEVTYWRV